MSVGVILGFFDGIHLGHKEVINSLLSKSKQSILLTFDKSPEEYFKKEYKYIFPREESLKRIQSLHVKDIIVQKFEEIADISAEDYLKLIVKKYNPKYIATGFNHTFGKNKEGNTSYLEQNQNNYGYKYICTPPFVVENDVVSSSLIKEYLKKGLIEKANKLLGSTFFIDGKVILGNQIGRNIGFPTANIVYPKNIAEIPYGVYFVKVKEKYGIMNYGCKPTVINSNKPVAEVHIFNFSGNLYNQNIKIEIIKYIREEKKFTSINELKKQIEKDKTNCLKLL